MTPGLILVSSMPRSISRVKKSASSSAVRASNEGVGVSQCPVGSRSRKVVATFEADELPMSPIWRLRVEAHTAGRASGRCVRSLRRARRRAHAVEAGVYVCVCL
jgi:hypothetical protein